MPKLLPFDLQRYLILETLKENSPPPTDFVIPAGAVLQTRVTGGLRQESA